MAVRESVMEYAKKQENLSRHFKNFTRGISTDATKSVYVYELRNFMQFHKLEDQYEKVAGFEDKEIDELFEKYIDDLIERGIQSVTIQHKLAGIERFFTMNDCIWHKDRIRKSIKKDDVIVGGKVPITTEEIQIMLKCTKSLRVTALIHFFSSTGARPGVCVDPVLRMKHLTKMPYPTAKDSTYCYGIEAYSGSKQAYWIFLTPEATKALDNYLNKRKTDGESLDDESILFMTQKRQATKVTYLTPENMRYVISNCFKQSGVKRSKVSKNRYDKSVIYGFRKRFNTILKLENSVNPNIAEKLMAHKRGLDGTYLQPTREECFAEFIKAIPQLTIDPTERLKQDNIDKEQQITELDAQKSSIQELKDDNTELRKSLEVLKEELVRYVNYAERQFAEKQSKQVALNRS